MSSPPAEGDGRARAPNVPMFIFAAVLVAAYIATPFRIGDYYPIARFAMFSHHVTADQRLLVRTPHHGLYTINTFGAYRCDAMPLDFDTVDATCPNAGKPPSYNEHHHRLWMEAHAVGPEVRLARSLEVEVIREFVSFPDMWGDPVVDHCVIARCTVGLMEPPPGSNVEMPPELADGR